MLEIAYCYGEAVRPHVFFDSMRARMAVISIMVAFSGPLDLRKHPPRSASVALNDIAYFPRVIDKIRAEFEGGHLGAYVVLGPDGTSGKTVTARFYRATGVVHDELVEAVKAANDDDSVADWLRKRVGAAAISKWNGEFGRTRLGDLKKLLGERLSTVYPIARQLADDTSLAQLLDADDLISFPNHNSVSECNA